jgi:hypothetical protein
MRTITTEDGRSAFGADAANYDSARPEYPARIKRALYASFSNVTTLPGSERIKLLDGIHAIAATTFQNEVERNMCTALYTARRR